MKKYKIRILAYGAELNAIIPFEQEPTIDQLHSKIIEYLNHNLFKIEYNVFVKAEHWTSTKKKRVLKYDIFYEEIKNESQPTT
jgi:hypothetical protein|tara:strand:+ start:216 stop:464 length:249 start_codon:yes stop_codon:yes gene_type:complete